MRRKRCSSPHTLPVLPRSNGSFTIFHFFHLLRRIGGCLYLRQLKLFRSLSDLKAMRLATELLSLT